MHVLTIVNLNTKSVLYYSTVKLELNLRNNFNLLPVIIWWLNLMKHQLFAFTQINFAKLYIMKKWLQFSCFSEVILERHVERGWHESISSETSMSVRYLTLMTAGQNNAYLIIYWNTSSNIVVNNNFVVTSYFILFPVRNCLMGMRWN